jgi:hypothetical protein
MKKVIVSLIIISTLLSGCASVVGGSSSPKDLMTKKVSGEYITEYEMIETFDCLARWVGSKNPIGLRREITADGLQGHLFWKDNFGWVNWTFLFKKAVNGEVNTLS